MTDLQRAKINLYRLLLEIKHDQMTDTEIEIMFQLSMDSDIQNQLDKGRQIAEIKPLSLQDLFDNAWKAFIIGDAKPAYKIETIVPGSEETRCCYLDDKGNKCAIGVSLPDGHPSQQCVESFGFLTHRYPELFDDSIKSLSIRERSLFQADLHDFLFDVNTLKFRPKEEMKEIYIKVAKRFNLTIPKEE